jgi:sterol desaturase/sphingolipid hydroxylase (fatty acid hydroxylase superfamily)
MTAIFARLVKLLYEHFPEAVFTDLAMIAGFSLLGVGFYLLCLPGGRPSLRSALAYVFRREFFRHPTSRVDLLHFVLTVGFWIPLVGALVTAFLSVNVRGLLASRFGEPSMLMQAGWAVMLSQFLVIFVCRDFGTYVGHLLLHKVPLLWSVHRTHHSAEVLTFFTSARAHPLEYLHMQVFIALFGALGGGIFLYLTGTDLQAMPVVLLLVVEGFFGTFGLAQHSHLPISFGPFDRILLAPVLHQLHHSAELRHRDKNLGGQLSLFDWLFGTLYRPQPGESYRWGLNDGELGENNPHLRLRDFYFEPARHAWRLLTQWPPGGPAHK